MILIVKKKKCGCEGCAYREKSADEMFKELDFVKDTPYKNIILYIDDDIEIEFQTDREVVTCDGDMSKEVVAAINKKVEELGWN